MRHVTVDDLKKQTIDVLRELVNDKVEIVRFRLKDFGAIEMENKIPFVREESQEMSDQELYDAAYERFASNINFQIDYVYHITYEPKGLATLERR